MKRSLELNRETLAKLDEAQTVDVQAGYADGGWCGVTRIGACVSRFAACTLTKPKTQA
jgi:hypothetical protein